MQSRIELQLSKWRNSLGIRIPKHIVDSLNLSPKDRMSCSIENGKLVLEPVRQPKYKLEELLAKVDEVDDEVFWGKLEGKEAW
ncbi:MAG TPA: AbrB/MazE/SpoVT family DNA-binding domain-containing protein [Thermodesulfobacteriota bacterium]|nr:AbrB/MazE/SpoVT family DNA-binding domain-containing protein [Thermodesulfobacteriota bacterium]